MPLTELRLYRDDDGSTPIIAWLANVRDRNPKT